MNYRCWTFFCSPHLLQCMCFSLLLLFSKMMHSRICGIEIQIRQARSFQLCLCCTWGIEEFVNQWWSCWEAPASNVLEWDPFMCGSWFIAGGRLAMDELIGQYGEGGIWNRSFKLYGYVWYGKLNFNNTEQKWRKRKKNMFNFFYWF